MEKKKKEFHCSNILEEARSTRARYHRNSVKSILLRLCSMVTFVLVSLLGEIEILFFTMSIGRHFGHRWAHFQNCGLAQAWMTTPKPGIVGRTLFSDSCLVQQERASSTQSGTLWKLLYPQFECVNSYFFACLLLTFFVFICIITKMMNKLTF